MAKPVSAVELQHDRQSIFREAEAAGIPSIISKPDSIDAWRHLRMYQPLVPLIEPGQTWLTIGDSGADAHWLRSQGVYNVTASSIVDTQLRNLEALGHLPGVNIAAVNAEHIDHLNGAYDFLLCKEAFHHFARPMVGFYEMLRVARQGVILLAEPNGNGRVRLLDIAKRGIKRVLRRGTVLANDQFESSGNFIYGPSLHEICKAATALQYRHLYYLHLNDFFIASLAMQPMANTSARRITRLAIAVQNLAARLKLMSWGSITVVLFKQSPTEMMSRELEKTGFRKHVIPVNPYL